MMDKRKGLSVLLAFSLALNCAFIGAWVYHYFVVRPALRTQTQQQTASGRPAMPLALEALNLSEEQRRRLAAEHVALRSEIETVRLRSDASRERLLEMFAARDSDPQALQAVQEEIAADQAQIRQLVFEYLVRARDVLNDEQRAKLGRMLLAGHGRRRRGPMQGMLPRHPEGRPSHRRPEPPEQHEPEKNGGVL